jgi:hypothetical protein
VTITPTTGEVGVAKGGTKVKANTGATHKLLTVVLVTVVPVTVVTATTLREVVLHRFSFLFSASTSSFVRSAGAK